MKTIFLFFCFLACTFCNSISAQTSGEKTTCACAPEAWVMIPYNAGTRLGWFDHGTLINSFSSGYFLALGIPPSIVWDDNTTTSAHTNRILNPSAVGGLHVTFPGLSSDQLYGMSSLGGPYPSFAFFFTGKFTVGGITDHYLIRAVQPVGGFDFFVDYVVKINAPFAPASSWTLHHIEAENSGIMWGLFRSGSQTYLAQFPIPGSSGGSTTASSVYFWPTLAINAMDVYNGYVHLIEFSTSMYQTYTISTATMNPPISMALTPGTSHLIYDNFLYIGPFTYSMNDFYRDDIAPGIRSQMTLPAPPFSNILYMLQDMTSVVGTLSPLNFIIPDSGHQ